jgi:hypothetical protein
LEHPINRFLVFLDRITISLPILQLGHGTKPFFGSFDPKITYFFLLADQERKELES